MERLILGIIAVICLHIGYVAYVYTDRPIVDTARNPPQTAVQPRPVTGLDKTFARIFPGGDISSTFESAEDRDTGPVSAKSVLTRTTGSDPSAPAARRVERYSSRVDPDDISDRGPFKPVTIEIPPPYIPKMPVEPERPAIKTSIQKTENKSFFASVMPVFKKPYSWIKALGSKLK